MLTMPELERLFRVEPGTRAKLKRRPTSWTGDEDLKRLDAGTLKNRAREFLEQNLARLSEAQARLYANDVYSVLVILQAMDAGGKDGMVKHVMSGVNPQGCRVVSFKRPSEQELDHTFLWRYACALPERGMIGIFNRSYYEETLIARVHPEVLARQRLPPGRRGRKFWHARYKDINAFERHLARNGTTVLKFFLHISRDEQKRRLLDRLDTPEKQWKFSSEDIEERRYWDDYQRAYEDTIAHTSTRRAPWWVVPSDNKWVSRAVVAAVVTNTIHGLELNRPRLTEAERAALDRARQQLLAES